MTSSVDFDVLKKVALRKGLSLSFSGTQRRFFERLGYDLIIAALRNRLHENKWTEVTTAVESLSNFKSIFSWVGYYECQVLTKGVPKSSLQWRRKKQDKDDSPEKREIAIPESYFKRSFDIGTPHLEVPSSALLDYPVPVKSDETGRITLDLLYLKLAYEYYGRYLTRAESPYRERLASFREFGQTIGLIFEEEDPKGAPERQEGIGTRKFLAEFATIGTWEYEILNAAAIPSTGSALREWLRSRKRLIQAVKGLRHGMDAG